MGETESRPQEINALRARARGLYNKGNVWSAIEVQRKIVEDFADAASYDDKMLLALYLYTAGRYDDAIRQLLKNHEERPDDVETIVNLGVVQLKVGHLENGCTTLENALLSAPDNSNLHDALAKAYGSRDMPELARCHGERALQLKHADVTAAALSGGLAKRPLPAFRADTPKRNVIAFSLWGRDERYLSGAERNAGLVGDIYPGWSCRFYCDDTVPDRVSVRLLALGADLWFMPRPRALFEGLFWRFDVANDPQIDRFLVRDADSVINVRERLAVDEWLASDRSFHVMRDYFTHTELILAGLWGGVAGMLPALRPLYGALLGRPTKTRTLDQVFLREHVWPLIANDTLIHDSWFRVLGARDFPRQARLAPGRHLGQNAAVHHPTSNGMIRAHSAAKTLTRRRTYIFCVTPGRSGTRFLADLLRLNLVDADIHHERTGFQNFGIHTPDASHFTLFNSVGNVMEVRAFWRRKFAALRTGEGAIYAETSHFLAKAGLIENLPVLDPRATIHMVSLWRDLSDIVISLVNRFDFANSGFTWLFALDRRYPRKILEPLDWQKNQMVGAAIWYVHEMRVRATYYRLLADSMPNVRFHEARLEEIVQPEGALKLFEALELPLRHQKVRFPKKANETREWHLPQKERERIRELVGRFTFEPEARALDFFSCGRRLGSVNN